MSGDYNSYKQSQSTSGKTSESKLKQQKNTPRKDSRGNLATEKANIKKKKKKTSKKSETNFFENAIDGFDEISKKRKRKKQIRIEKKEIKNIARSGIKKRTKEFRNKIKMIHLVGAILVIYLAIASWTIVHNNSKISELKYTVTTLNIEINRQGNLINELEAKRESTYKSQTIENYAKYKLGMIYPTKAQTVYIKVG